MTDGNDEAPGRDADTRSLGPQPEDQAAWPDVRRLFDRAVELESEERAALLAEEALHRPAVVAEVERLLVADQEESSPLDSPAAELAFNLISGDQAGRSSGRRLGRHRLIEEIGRGGMGTIYRAVRDDGEYEEEVAVKVVKPGFGGEALVERFRQERQILAQLNHPNMTRILDGGMTDEGLPYFVMEHIEGEPIDHYCDERRLSIDERVHLLGQVCAAVEVAHRSLIVHCDLKPSNILVTADGVPKLLDFGVARLLEGERSDGSGSGQSSPWARAFTPDYASPEQLEGRSLTTATDVYSLGVVLHELLTGDVPVRRSTAGAPWTSSALVVEKAAEDEPAAVARARARGVTPKKLAGRLRGDLDAILGKALAVDPAERYGSAQQLADDLGRASSSLPVRARSATLSYRLSRLIRRRWAPLSAAALLLASLTAGVAATLHQARVAEDRGRQAEHSLQFLTDLFAATDPDATVVSSDLVLADVLSEAAVRLPEEFATEPLGQARLMHTLGAVLISLGRYDEAEPLANGALEVHRRELGGRDSRVADGLDQMGYLRMYQGRLDEAEPLLDEALALRRELFGDRDSTVADSVHRIGLLRRRQGRLDEAEASYREALELRRELLGEHPKVAATMNNLGVVLRRRGALDEAEELLSEALSSYRELLGEEHWRVGSTMSNLALVARQRRQYGEAAELYRQALAIQERELGASHPEAATTRTNLGVALHRAGDLETAELRLREALESQRIRLGEGHMTVALIRGNLGAVLFDQNRMGEARRVLDTALAVLEAELGADDPRVGTTQNKLAEVLLRLGEPAAAEKLLRATLESRRRRQDPAAVIAIAEARLGGCLVQLGRLEEAAELLSPAVETLARERGPDHRLTVEARGHLEALERTR